MRGETRRGRFARVLAPNRFNRMCSPETETILQCCILFIKESGCQVINKVSGTRDNPSFRGNFIER